MMALGETPKTEGFSVVQMSDLTKEGAQSVTTSSSSSPTLQ